MVTALQIVLLLILIALIGIIIGYIFGKLACKKHSKDQYFEKNEYCETDYVASNALIDDNEKPSILSDNNVATVAKEDSITLETEDEDNKNDTLSEAEATQPQGLLSENENESSNKELSAESEESSTKPDSADDNKEESITLDSKEEESISEIEENKEDTASEVEATQPQGLISENEDKDSAKELSTKSEDSLTKTSDADEKEEESKDDTKPPVLTEPRGGKADNLCRIKGVGFVIEEKLHNLGVFHFDQIAAWTENEIKWVDSHLSFSGRILRDDWIGQAKKLAAGEETEFSKRVDKGEVATSRQTKENEK